MELPRFETLRLSRQQLKVFYKGQILYSHSNELAEEGCTFSYITRKVFTQAQNMTKRKEWLVFNDVPILIGEKRKN